MAFFVLLCAFGYVATEFNKLLISLWIYISS